MHRKKLYYFFIYELCPWFLYLLGELLANRFGKFIGFDQPDYLTVMRWQNRTLCGVSDLANNCRWAELLFQKFQKDHRFLDRVEKNYYAKMTELYNFIKREAGKNLQNKTRVELWQVVDGFRKRFDAMYLWGWIPNGLEGEGALLSNYLKKKIGKKMEKIDKEERTAEYLATLVTSTLEIPRQAEEKSFLKIAQTIEADRGLLKLFREEGLERAKLILEQKFPSLAEKIEAHRRRFAWLMFKYEGPEWDTAYLLGLIKDFFVQGRSAREKIVELKTRKKTLLANQRKFAGKIKLAQNKDLSYFIGLSRRFMHLKEHQKDYLFMTYYQLDKVICEAASRLYLSPTQFRHLLHEEMKAALLENRYDVNLLNERIKHCILLLRPGKTEIYSGIEAKKLAKKYIPPLPKQKVFYGQSAHEGFVKGKVRIIQETRDIAKMQQGDILLTTRTNPNLLPAMRKAAAIVADIGGVTSHAAIISRELKIPCVVGVRTASMILKDDDLIEVDADQGVVKIIKQAE